MLRSVLISIAGAVAIALLMAFLGWTRKREKDPSGRPTLRYLAAPYLMSFCGLIFIAAGIYEWFVPLNHQYPGNLLLLSFLPSSAGVFAFGMAVYFLTFKALLTNQAIELYRWPLGHTSFNLRDLQQIETKGQNTILHFAGGKKFTVYYNYSGATEFLSALRANKH
jgi:hypothetical protein